MSSEDSSSPAFRPSQSTSQLPNPSSSADTSAAPHRATQSTSRLPFLPLNNGTQHKTQNLICGFDHFEFLCLYIYYLYSIKDGSSSSGSNDSDSSEERGKRRKNFEVLPRSCQSRSACPTFLQAFVMTGDRMINLAKTPANADWKSK